MAPQAQAQNGATTLVVFHKTRMCQFYQQSSCSRGTQCSFAHSPAELRPTPDFKCTRLCERLIATGRCDIPGCTYAHNRQELRRRKPTVAEIVTQGAQKQKETTSKRRQRGRKLKIQVDSDEDVAMPCPAGSSSPVSTCDLEMSESSWCRRTSCGSSSTCCSSAGSPRTQGDEETTSEGNDVVVIMSHGLEALGGDNACISTKQPLEQEYSSARMSCVHCQKHRAKSKIPLSPLEGLRTISLSLSALERLQEPLGCDRSQVI
eukprot:6470887-Amphidinium_carterae.1